MMQSFLPSSLQVVREEKYQPPNLLFDGKLGNSTISPMPRLSSSTRKNYRFEQLKKYCRAKMVFVSKVIAVGFLLSLISGTAFYATLSVVEDADPAIDNDRKPTLPIILSLSVDEATAKKIASVDKLQNILNGNEERPGAFEIRNWGINNGKDIGFSRSKVDDELLALELLLHPDETANDYGGAAAARDGHGMLRGRRTLLDADWDMAFGWFSNWKKIAHEARPVPTNAKQPNSSLTNSYKLAPITLSDGFPWGKWVLQRLNYKENEIEIEIEIEIENEDEDEHGNEHENGDDGDGNAFYGNDYLNRQRHRALSTTVNDAFHDSENLLLTLLEDTICSMIKQAFPGALPEIVEQQCRLEYSKGIFENGVSAANNFLVGNDRDEHGCIPSAGYSWCQALNKCHRPWETLCEVVDGDNYTIEKPLLGVDRDEHGCNRSAGFLWCDASKSCQKPWETACG